MNAYTYINPPSPCFRPQTALRMNQNGERKLSIEVFAITTIYATLTQRTTVLIYVTFCETSTCHFSPNRNECPFFPLTNKRVRQGFDFGRVRIHNI